MGSPADLMHCAVSHAPLPTSCVSTLLRSTEAQAPAHELRSSRSYEYEASPSRDQEASRSQLPQP
jgi:hypothetical protein